MNADELFKFLGALAAACVVVGSATWALRSKLDDVKEKISQALQAHVEDDRKTHAELKDEIVKLQKVRRKR